MIRRIQSATIVGVEGRAIEVEVQVTSSGLPGVVLVGLPDAAIREARDRVRSAINSSRYSFPPDKVIVNLAPADLRKEGTLYDLPIALGIIAASDGYRIPQERLAEFCIVGELALDGRVRPVRGALSMAIAMARLRGRRRMMLPRANAAEAAIVEGFSPVAVRTLAEAVGILSGTIEEPALPSLPPRPVQAEADIDYADVRGQAHSKRAMLIAAGGGHNVLLYGSPGAGKTMLARRMPTILPPLSHEESLEVTQIHSVAGILPPGETLIRRSPFRAPHHTASYVALFGGGSVPRPGEISLAHGGVLFLDEMAEFSRRTLETLRQPLEEGELEITRASGRLRLPARALLVGATNPCPCGYRGHATRECRCTPRQVARYVGRLSGPLLDRIDLHVDVPALPLRELSEASTGEGSAEMRSMVMDARERQARRGSGPNGRLPARRMAEVCRLDPTAEALLHSAAERFSFSARAYHQILRVARTIADLAARDAVGAEQIAEAIRYRGLDEGSRL